ncbi:MAG: orotidine 5'-phosphate decarboxylase [Acidobacteria bacterium]|nr:orotidine 5'-phosphate decarboxylase [Acidobacteriota bacterium]
MPPETRTAPGARRIRLQLAIDFLEADGAEALLAKVRDLIDIVEVGTPVIIRDGVGTVRRLHGSFPDLSILADLKIADGGRFEASLAFEAGARIVTVMATAADVTVAEAVHAAREHGGEIMVDLMGVKDIARRAAQVERLGVHYVCVHTAVDEQRAGARVVGRALAGLRAVSRALRTAGTAVAGGITPVTARELAPLAPSIVIVGSGITRAVDPRAAAAAIREALDRGGEGRA